MRGTLLVSSMRGLREAGLFERYRALLPDGLSAVMASIVAGEWVPMGTALEHYGACDRLGLSNLEQVAMGTRVATGIYKTLFGTVLRAAGETGATPWTALRKFASLYERNYRGGGARVVKVGPKDAHIEIFGLPLARYAYSRNAFRGTLKVGAELFGGKCFVTQLPSGDPQVRFVNRLAWT